MAVKQAARQQSKKYKRYTEDEWREAVADVPVLGLTASAAKHRVTRTTLGSWVSGAKRPRGWTPAWKAVKAPAAATSASGAAAATS